MLPFLWSLMLFINCSCSFQIINCRKENRWILIDNFHLLYHQLYLLKLPPSVNKNFRVFLITDHQQMARYYKSILSFFIYLCIIFLCSLYICLFLSLFLCWSFDSQFIYFLLYQIFCFLHYSIFSFPDSFYTGKSLYRRNGFTVVG